MTDSGISNLILRSGLILVHAALHCKTPGIYDATRRGYLNRLRGPVHCAATISSRVKWLYLSSTAFESLHSHDTCCQKILR